MAESYPRGEGGRVLLAQNRFLPLQWLLYAVYWGRVAGNSGHHENGRYTKGFPVQNQKNQSSNADSANLSPKNRVVIVRVCCDQAEKRGTHD